MKFYKGCESLSFFISTYLVFFLHIFFVFCIEDNTCEESGEINKILIIHKKIIFVIFIFTFFSHFFASFTEPGSIEYDKNIEILESYNFIYKEINIIKNKYNRIKKGEETDENSSDESSNFKLSSEEDNDIKLNDINYISANKEKIISKKYNFTINKCKSCKVLRPENSHHCSYCHFCILDAENHCPWLNNCVGLFNKKSYLLFCLYSVILVGYSFIIYFYYNIFKNFHLIRYSISQTFLSVFWMFYSFVYSAFCFMLLSDERNNYLTEFKNFGKEKNKLIKLKMRLIFGGNFSLKWFFPCFSGGKKYIFSFLKRKNKDDYKHKKFKKAIIKTNK